MKRIFVKIFNKIEKEYKNFSKKIFHRRKYPNLDDLQENITISRGTIKDVKINLISIMRDEEFFLPSFFDHYRKIGVQQFIILDDRSTDSTPHYLSEQKDCVVLKTELKFGENLTVRMPSNKVSSYRAGLLLRSVIARKYCMHKYALIVDADEFLLLPSNFGNLLDLFDFLESKDIRGVAANMIDFYPESIQELQSSVKPDSFSDLVRNYPYFDAVPLLQFENGDKPMRVGNRASFRLISDFEKETLPSHLRQEKKPRAQEALKCPILYWDQHAYLAGSHHASVKISKDILLALAHFVFTHDFFSRAERSAARGEHAGGASKYKLFRELSTYMLENDKKFICDTSERFSTIQRLEELNLLGNFISTKKTN